MLMLKCWCTTTSLRWWRTCGVRSSCQWSTQGASRAPADLPFDRWPSSACAWASFSVSDFKIPHLLRCLGVSLPPNGANSDSESQLVCWISGDFQLWFIPSCTVKYSCKNTKNIDCPSTNRFVSSRINSRRILLSKIQPMNLKIHIKASFSDQYFCLNLLWLSLCPVTLNKSGEVGCK